MEITAYICNNQLKGINTNAYPLDNAALSSIRVNDGIIDVPLISLSDGDPSNFYVEVSIHNMSSKIPRLCRLTGVLDWEFVTTRSVRADFDYYILNYIEISYLNPDICDWEYTRLLSTHESINLTILPSTGDGECPEIRQDALGGQGILTLDDNKIVPGENLALSWKFESHDFLFSIKDTYIYSCCLTGGYIEAVNKDSEYAYEITYDVRIEGNIYTGLLSTDLFDYQVGDWVFILKSGRCKKDITSPPSKGVSYKEFYDAGGIGLIAPIKIYGTKLDGIGPTI